MKKLSPIQDLVDAAAKNLEKSKICNAQRIKHFSNEELRSSLKDLYKSRNARLKITGSIINSIFFEKKSIFLLSKSTLESLLKSDPNIKRSTIGDDFKEVMSFLLGNNVLIRIADGAEYRGMSVYELIHPWFKNLFVEIYGPDTYDEKRKQCLEVFNTYISKHPMKVPDKGSLECEVESEVASDNEIKSDDASDKPSPKQASQNNQGLRQPAESKAAHPAIIHDLRYLDAGKIKDIILALQQLPELTDWESQFLNSLPDKVARFSKLTEEQILKIREIIEKRGQGRFLYQEKLTESEKSDLIKYKKLVLSGDIRRHGKLNDEIILDCKNKYFKMLRKITCTISDREAEMAWEKALQEIISYLKERNNFVV